jgi:hypothetical protein
MLSFAQGYLENPVANSTESGIGVISGWHCTAKEITVFIDGVSQGKSGVGSLRSDTGSICGHTSTGFSLLYNYSKPNEGVHEIAVYADGALLEKRLFNTVRSGGVPFLRDQQKTVVVPDFPNGDSSTILEWSQAKQTFVVVGSADITTLDGEYSLQRATIQMQDGTLLDTEGRDGFYASGTMYVNGASYRQTMSVRVYGQTASDTVNGYLSDRGHYLYDDRNGNKVVVVDRGARLIMSLLSWSPVLGYFNEIDYWVKR